MSDKKPTDYQLDKNSLERCGGTPSRRDQDQQLLITTPNNMSSVERGLTGWNDDSQAQLSGGHLDQPQEAERASLKINSLILGTNMRTDQRNLTQGAGSFQRQGSPSKQSVLVKRVMRDGRVVSGLETMRGNRNSVPLGEEAATLAGHNGSGGGKNNTTANARESHIVNQGTQHDTSEANKLRSTMYATGKSQKFPHGVDKLRQGVTSGTMGVTGSSMVFNLGERDRFETNNFGNIALNAQASAPDVEMVIGVTDIVTGAVKIQNTNSSNQQFCIPPVGLMNYTNSQSIYQSSDFRSNMPMMHATLATQDSQIYDEGAEKIRASMACDSGGMQIHSISPNSMKVRGRVLTNEPRINKNERSRQTSDLLLQGQSLATMRIDSQARQQRLLQQQSKSPTSKPEMTGLSVTIVDARSMIPSQPIPKDQHGNHSPRHPTKHLKTGSRSPKTNNSELKRFHKATAQQYKDFMKQRTTEQQFRISQQERFRNNYSSRMVVNHDNSQSTLMDNEGIAVDNSHELKPGLINQGTSIMMKSLEHEILNLKTVEFYAPNTGVSRTNVDNGDAFLLVTNQVQANKDINLDTIRSENGSTEVMIGTHTQQNFSIANNALLQAQGNQTLEHMSRLEQNSYLDNAAALANQKMLQTYRGADNMKLKIIDQSVLKTYAAMHSKAGSKMDENLRSSPSRASGNRGVQIMMDEGYEGPKRKSIIVDSSSVGIDHRDHHTKHALNGMLMPSYLSPYESSIMQKASPMNKIESFRKLLRQESAANDQKIMSNQDNFKNLINPEVTRKEFKVFNTKPSSTDLNASILQNHKSQSKKDDSMLQTVTKDFLEENLNATTKTTFKQSISPRSQRITMDIRAFRQQLAKKIDEIRQMGDPNADQHGDPCTQMSSQESGSLKQTLKLGVRKFSLDDQERIAKEHNLFMTYLHQEQSKTRVDFAIDNSLTPSKQDSLKQKRLTELSIDLGKSSIELPVVSPMYTRANAAMQSSESSKKKKISGPFKGEHDLVSFADQASTCGQPAHQKSGITLASSGSSKTVNRMAKRYLKEHRIVVFEDGAEMCNSTPCVVVELNSLLRKHYLQQNGSSSFTTQQEDINTQIVIYQRAVREVLDRCGTNLIVDGELSPEEVHALNGAAPKRFNQLYTVYGEPVNSLLQIDEECCMLIAGDKNDFQGLKTNDLFRFAESANAMLNRIVQQSPIAFDYKSVQKIAHSANISTQKFESPFKRKYSNESLGKTFALTQQQSGVVDTAPTSPKRDSQPMIGSRNQKRGVSLTSRDIIKASKDELMRRFATKGGGSMSQRTSGATMNSKRLASMTMITKGIKRGKLPPIKTPSQLDVFVFGEHQQSHVSPNQTIEQQLQTTINPLPLPKPKQQPIPSNVIKRRVQRTLTILETANEGSIDPRESTNFVQTDITVADMIRKKRGTQAQLRTREQYVDSDKEQSLNSLRNKSSMGICHSPNLDFGQTIYSEIGKDKVTAVNLRRKLDAVHSIQMIEDPREQFLQVAAAAAPSTNSYRTEKDFYTVDMRLPKAKITARNIGIARMAIKERSPSYISNKLVSQISLVNSKQKQRMKLSLTQRQKDKLKAESNEHVLQNAISQRKQWREEFNLDERQLFSLFSEFSSMMQINRMQLNDQAQDSMATRMKHENEKTGEQDEKIVTLFPIGANVSSTKYNLMRREEKHKSFQIPSQDYAIFRVPVQVCIDYSEVLRPTKMRLRAIVLNAFGVLASYAKSNLSMDQFLRINSFLRFGNHTSEEFMWFCVKLFDPQLNGYKLIEDCMEVVDLLFDNQDEDGKTTKAPEVKLPPQQQSSCMNGDNTQSAGDMKASAKDIGKDSELPQDAVSAAKSQEGDGYGDTMNSDQGKSDENAAAAGRANESEEAKDESVSANIKKVCYERGIFKADGFLDPHLLYQAFKEEKLDIEDFKSALK